MKTIVNAWGDLFVLIGNGDCRCIYVSPTGELRDRFSLLEVFSVSSDPEYIDPDLAVMTTIFLGGLDPSQWLEVD